jgi:DNA-binding PucR family transcriptional regulator
MNDARAMRETFLGLAAQPGWMSDLASTLADAVVAELPELARGEIHAALLASSEANVRLVADMLRSGLDPAEATPPPGAVEYARELVHQGGSIDLLLRAYFVGHAAFLRVWVERVDSEIQDLAQRAAAVEQAALWTSAYVQALTRGVVERYTDERERWVRSAVAVRADVVRGLLAGDRVDPEAASARLRYILDREHLAFVVWAAGGDPAGLEQVAIELTRPLELGGPLLVAFGTDVVAGWVGTRTGFDGNLGRQLRRLPAEGARVAFGAPAHGVGGFRVSHLQAQHARRVAVLRGAPPGSVTCYSDEALAALASADLEHARAFVAAELGPLAGGDAAARRLSETLRVYLEEHASPRRAAQRLGVHENTIANRVRAAAELLGGPAEVRTAERLVALRLADLAATGGAVPGPGAAAR